MNRKILIATILIAVFVAFYLLDKTSVSNGLNYTVGPNGIWKDVQPFIDAHSHSTNHRKALEQLFKDFQKTLLDPEIGVEIKEGRHRDDLGRDFTCHWKTVGFDNRIDVSEIENAIINNVARARAYSKYNGNLSGGMYPSWNEKKDGSPCDF